MATLQLSPDVKSAYLIAIRSKENISSCSDLAITLTTKWHGNNTGHYGFTNVLDYQALAVIMIVFAFTKAFFIFAFVIMLVFWSGSFGNVHTELGSGFYAEKPSLTFILPRWVKMPLNTVINVGYMVVGIYWLVRIEDAHIKGNLPDRDVYPFHVFSWMTIFYGPVQFMRILTEYHNFAVCDQWLTLPFFMWVVLWSLYFLRHRIWSGLLETLLMCLSIGSYLLALLHKSGYELSLGVHISFAVCAAAIVVFRFPNKRTFKSLAFATLYCTGFVVLKLLDLYLPNINAIFSYVSGHFLSKICDCLQIHFANVFFRNVLYSDKARIPQGKLKKN